MIGWYHSGPKLRASDQEINDLFKKFIARPVMVIVDVRPQTVGIPTDAYFAVEEIKDVSTTAHSNPTAALLTFHTGRNRDTKNLPPRSIRDRSRGGRGNRRRASVTRHQRFHHNDPRHPSQRTASVPPRAPVTAERYPKVPRGRRRRDDAREPSNNIPPARRA